MIFVAFRFLHAHKILTNKEKAGQTIFGRRLYPPFSAKTIIEFFTSTYCPHSHISCYRADFKYYANINLVLTRKIYLLNGVLCDPSYRRIPIAHFFRARAIF